MNLDVNRAIRAHTDLLEDLRRLLGTEQILSDPLDLLVYECDAYTLEKKIPSLVVLPNSTFEVAEIVRCCNKHGVPFIPRGAGTNLSGAILPIENAVIISLTRMNKVLQVDIENRRALVESGCVNLWITNAVRSAGLLYAPDPSSQTACTIGGNVATNSGGPHTLKYGVTTNHVLGFEMVLPDGEVTWLGTTLNGGEETGGLDLRGAVIGCEGMFGVVTRVVVNLIPAPQSWRTLLGVFSSVEDASQAVSDIIASGIVPAALEMMDQLITQAVEAAYKFGFPLDAGALLIVELDGLEADLENQAIDVERLCLANNATEVRRARTDKQRADLWKCRKRAFGAIGRLSPNFLTQDGVVPRSKLPEIMRFIQHTSVKFNLRIPNVFHAGDGNIHPLILYNEAIPEEVVRAVQAGNEILDRCLELGGSVSGEHGIGVEKASFMEKQFSKTDIEAMMTLRRIFDPEQRCNPHKMFPNGKRCMDFAPRRQISV